MSRRPPKSSDDGWFRATEIVFNDEGDLECRPAQNKPVQSVEPALRRESPSREAGEAGHFSTNQPLPDPGRTGATSAGNRQGSHYHTADKVTNNPFARSPSQDRSPKPALSNICIDPQPPSQNFFENANSTPSMDSNEPNYTYISNTHGAVSPGQSVPRSEIPRTLGLDYAAVLPFLQDTPIVFMESKIARMTSESERYQNMVSASENRKLEPTAPRTAAPQNLKSNTSIKPQNAQAAEHRQSQPRLTTPEQNDKDEEDDQESSSNDDRNRHGCRQH